MPALLVQASETAKQVAEVRPPVLEHKVEADYTADARQKGLEGVSKLFAEIGKDGIPVNIRVVKPLDPGLDAKAVQALKQWRFRPGERDGKPVSVPATIEFRFRLSKFALLPDPSMKPEEEPVEDNDPLYPIWW
jgi:TonB family protein